MGWEGIEGAGNRRRGRVCKMILKIIFKKFYASKCLFQGSAFLLRFLATSLSLPQEPQQQIPTHTGRTFRLSKGRLRVPLPPYYV